MIEIKAIVKLILNVVEKIGPTLATLTAVYLAYIYAKKQRIFEYKSEEDRRIRSIVSHLIQIWRELSNIEFYASSNDFYADMVFIDNQFASNYFNIDLKRVEHFNHLFEVSKEEIKSVNVALFYSLEKSYFNFQKSLKILNSSDKTIRYNDDDIKKTLNELLTDSVRDLERIIFEASQYLPKNEIEQINQIIKEHHNSLKETDIEYDVPNFLINLINKHLPVKEIITSDEINYFFQDSVVKLIFKYSPSLDNLVSKIS